MFVFACQTAGTGTGAGAGTSARRCTTTRGCTIVSPTGLTTGTRTNSVRGVAIEHVNVVCAASTRIVTTHSLGLRTRHNAGSPC